MIQFSRTKGLFSRDSNTAIILLLLKKENADTLELSPPIIVKNSDLSLHAKLLGRILKPYMTNLVYHDQTGFIETCLASDNISCQLHIIDAAADVELPAAVLSRHKVL